MWISLHKENSLIVQLRKRQLNMETSFDRYINKSDLLFRVGFITLFININPNFEYLDIKI